MPILTAPHTVRTTGVFSKKDTLEHLHTFKNFPVFMGCTDAPRDEDIFLDLSFSICTETGLIQVDLVPDLSVLYQLPHNDAYGVFWQELNSQFADFIEFHTRSIQNILEIGGGSGKLAHEVLARRPDLSWLLADPNPFAAPHPCLRMEKVFFNDNFPHPKNSFDMIVHSHLIEHVFDVEVFLKSVWDFLKVDGLHIFNFPNFNVMLHRGYPNTINFEHTLCLYEEYVTALLEATGFYIEDKQYSQDGGNIFLCARKINASKPLVFPNMYETAITDWNYFKTALYSAVDRLNNALVTHDGPVYLFGAHIFSHYLLGAGLQSDNIAGLLDNSDLKNTRRLYGTRFTSEKPTILEGVNHPGVLLYVAQYRDEIVKQLREINPDVVCYE